MAYLNFSKSIALFIHLSKDNNIRLIYNDFEVNIMSFLRKHAEIIFSYLIGIVSLFTGLIILINLPLIKQLNGGKKLIHMFIMCGNF